MEREWKTWSEIAIMITEKIRKYPIGERLHKLEFEGVIEDDMPKYFTIEAEVMPEEDEAKLVECIVKMVECLLGRYEIVPTTMH